VITVSVVAVFSLLFFLQPHEIKKDFSAVYFISYEKNEPVFFMGNKSFEKHYQKDSYLLGSHLYRQKQVYGEKSIFGSRDFFQVLTDLLSISIMEHLLQHYSKHWYGQQDIIQGPGIVGHGFKPKEIPEFLENHVTTYKKEIWSRSFEKNIFIEDLPSIPDTLALPEGAKISYKRDTSSNHAEIILRKPFWFDISIKIQQRVSVAGLGNMMEILFPDSINDSTFDEKYNRQKPFKTILFKIECKAKFNRFLPGNRYTLAYREWVDELFNMLYQAYDWELFEKQIYNQMQIDTAKAITRMTGLKNHK